MVRHTCGCHACQSQTQPSCRRPRHPPHALSCHAQTAGWRLRAQPPHNAHNITGCAWSWHTQQNPKTQCKTRLLLFHTPAAMLDYEDVTRPWPALHIVYVTVTSMQPDGSCKTQHCHDSSPAQLGRLNARMKGVSTTLASSSANSSTYQQQQQNKAWLSRHQRSQA